MKSPRHLLFAGLLCLTRTFAYPLSAESRAVDAGRCLLATDQRGVTRPAGVGCDIGAMEYDPRTGLGEAVYLPAVMR